MTRIPKDQREYLKSKGLWVSAEDRENNTSKSKASIFADSAAAANEIRFKESFLESDMYVNPTSVFRSAHIMFDCAEEIDYFHEDILRGDFEFGVFSSLVSGITSRIVETSKVKPTGLLPPGFSLDHELLEKFVKGVGSVKTTEFDLCFAEPESEIKALSRALVLVSSGSRVCDAISSMWLPVVTGDKRTSAILTQAVLEFAENGGIPLSEKEIRPWLFSGFVPEVIMKFLPITDSEWIYGLSRFFQEYKDGPSFKRIVSDAKSMRVLKDLRLYVDDDHINKLMVEKSLYSVATDARTRVIRFADYWHIPYLEIRDMQFSCEPSPFQLCRFKGDKLLGPSLLESYLPDDFSVVSWSAVLWFPNPVRLVEIKSRCKPVAPVSLAGLKLS
jgi:hypothetical protein